MPTVKDLKELYQSVVSEFRQRYGLDREEHPVVEVASGEGVLKGRVTAVEVDMEAERLAVHVCYPDEIGYVLASRKHVFSEEDFQEGRVRAVAEEPDECVHLWRFSRETEETIRVVTLGGVQRKPVCKYVCAICGEERYAP